MKRSAWLVMLLAVMAGCAKKAGPTGPTDAGPPQDHLLHIQGIVTDSANGQPLAGVTVTLFGETDQYGNPISTWDAGSASTTTDSKGYFHFPVMPDVHDLMLTFEAMGFASQRLIVNPTGGLDSVQCTTYDAGLPCAVPSNLGVVDANVALTPVVTVAVQGTVWAGQDPAVGAIVQIVAPNALTTPILPAVKTDVNGNFWFPSVPAGTYDLTAQQLPGPNDGGVDLYEFTVYPLGTIPNSNENTTTVNIQLVGANEDIAGGTFNNLQLNNAPITYPITAAQLMTDKIQGIIAPLTGQKFSLIFGAPVDKNLTQFQLVQYDQLNRTSAPIPIGMTTTWVSDVEVQFTPQWYGPTPDGGMPDAGVAQPSLVSFLTYELQILTLRFQDGTIAIPSVPGVYGSIKFVIDEDPPLAPNSLPSFYVDSPTATPCPMTAPGSVAGPNPTTPGATHVAVDSSNLWLLDKNNDFIFDTDPVRNWGPLNEPISLPQIQWQHAAGSYGYRVYGRMVPPMLNGMPVAAPGPINTPQQWQNILLPIAGATDPTVVPDTPNSLNCQITATINPYNMENVIDQNAPWLYGWTMQIAVTSLDAAGYETPIDNTGTLIMSTTDTFPGLLVGGEVDPDIPVVPGVTNPFVSTTEYGDLFYKTVRFDFSEPMNPTLTPTFKVYSNTVQMGNTMVMPPIPKLTGPVAWGDTNAPSLTPQNTGTSVYANMAMIAKTPCTETLLPRFVGDNMIVVRDSSIFTSADNGDTFTGVVFLDPNPPPGAKAMDVWRGELASIQTAKNGVLTATMGQSLLKDVPAHSLVCALGNVAQQLVSVPGGMLSPTAPLSYGGAAQNLFYGGQTVVVYDFAATGNGISPTIDILNVAGADMMDGIATYPSSFSPNGLSGGHRGNMSTYIFPVDFGGEHKLRPQYDLTSLVSADVLGAGPGTIIPLQGFAKLGAANNTVVSGAVQTPPVFPVTVGDTVLIDLDGNLATSPDQYFLNVDQVIYDNGQGMQAYNIQVNLPMNTVLFQGTSRVIDLGDAIFIDQVHDTTPLAKGIDGPYHLDPHRNTLTPNLGAIGSFVYGCAGPAMGNCDPMVMKGM